MVVFFGVLLIAWPVIGGAVFLGMATHKKWCSYDTLAILSGASGILAGIYYTFLFSGFNLSNVLRIWYLWLGGILLSGLLGWFIMHNNLRYMQERELEKKLRQEENGELPKL